ncbi:Glutamate racemase [Desulfosarcina cetonica]|nr:Glutamate racemase [Desulfosarcina cetonica]
MPAKNRKENRNMTEQPIGVMDSGLGGLSVWQALIQCLPEENFIYLGDSGFCPYGSKSAAEILPRVTHIVDFLEEKGCKAIVVACNAITAASIDFLRQHYPIPFIGMEPAIKPASVHTRTRAVGVLATERTLQGRLFATTRSKYAQGIRVVAIAGNGLVEQVEVLDFDGDATMDLLRRYLRPMLTENIDHLVLGCTHYPFLAASIRRIVGDGVCIVNPAPAVARHTLSVLEQMQIRHPPNGSVGRSIFYTTGDTEKMKHMLSFIQAADREVTPVRL